MQIKDKELHRVALTAIIYNDEGKYLITKRSLSKKVMPGKWTVPGGGLNVDDYIHSKPDAAGQWYGALTNTLRREIREETGLEIEKPEYLLDLTFVRPDNIPVVVLSYFAKLMSGSVKLNDESVDFAWITVEEVQKYDLIAGIGDEIRQVDLILQKLNSAKDSRSDR